MTRDPGSLDDLRDIFEPEPVSWWPLAPGWWVLSAIIAVATVALAIRAWQTWRSNSYRRAALKELQSASTAAAIAQILKRTALSAFPRSQVASLSGSAWCDWLGETGLSDVPVAVAQLLTSGIYWQPASERIPLAAVTRPQDLATHRRATVAIGKFAPAGRLGSTPESVQPLLDFATVWIKTHTRPMED